MAEVELEVRRCKGYLSDLLAFAIHRCAEVEREVLEAGSGARQGAGGLQRRGPQTASSFCRDGSAKVKGKRDGAGWLGKPRAPSYPGARLY